VIQELLAMFTNDLHLGTKFNEGVQLVRVRILDKLSFHGLKLCLLRFALLLDLLEFLLEKHGLGGSQTTFGSLDNLGL